MENTDTAPVTIRQICREEIYAAKAVRKTIGSTAQLPDAMLDLYDWYLKEIGRTKHSLDALQIRAFLNCVQALRYELICGALALFRGHPSDYARYTRRAIELAVFAIEIYKEPEAGKRWMGMALSKKAEKKYRSAFNIMELITKHTPLIGQDLADLYEELSMFVHPSFMSVGSATRIKDSVHTFRFFEIESDRDFVKLVAYLFKMLDTHSHILNALRSLFESSGANFNYAEFDRRGQIYTEQILREKQSWLQIMANTKWQADEQEEP